MLDAYTEGRIDALYLASNEFVNTMTQAPSGRAAAAAQGGRVGLLVSPLGLHL